VEGSELECVVKEDGRSRLPLWRAQVVSLQSFCSLSSCYEGFGRAWRNPYINELTSSLRSCSNSRRILIFPQGNANGQPNDMVSVYLDYANPKAAAEGWHSCAQFALAISNPNDPSVFTVSREFSPFLSSLAPLLPLSFESRSFLSSSHHFSSSFGSSSQTPTIDSSPKSATGVSRGSPI